MPRHITVATCSLNQWVLDFEGNTNRIIDSISLAKAGGAAIRLGPEMEITGYGCQDHFLEDDTYLHCWEMLARILVNDRCQDILIDLGMPVKHADKRYSCRVLLYNRRILIIRPKLSLKNGGLFNESRYFAQWEKSRGIESHSLDATVTSITGQLTAPFGDIVLRINGIRLGWMFGAGTLAHDRHVSTSQPYDIEIFLEPSARHYEFETPSRMEDHTTKAESGFGGIVLYSNLKGCDGDRYVYDGCSSISVNNIVISQTPKFSFNDVEVITATVDLEQVSEQRSYGGHIRPIGNATVSNVVDVDIVLSNDKSRCTSSPIFRNPTSKEEEFVLGAACWLWDYLRRCHKSTGLFIPLSGGIDSCATALVAFSMCRELVRTVEEGNNRVLHDIRRVCGEPDDTNWIPRNPQRLCERIVHTCYMKSTNSSEETRLRALHLAEGIGTYHISVNIDSIVSSVINTFVGITRFTPRFLLYGGTKQESLALENIQARTRMVLGYLLAQLLPMVRRNSPTSLLVLSSTNVDECIRGYLTKYDCSSGDLNPIGSLAKDDIRSFVVYARDAFSLPILDNFLEASPTAELEPRTNDYIQTDEKDLGLTHSELSTFARLRMFARLGPWGMYHHLKSLAGREDTVRIMYEKIRRFFNYYALNRHKMTVLTPSYHAGGYSVDDRRFDRRPFLYPIFSWPYKKIENDVNKTESLLKNDLGCEGKE